MRRLFSRSKTPGLIEVLNPHKIRGWLLDEGRADSLDIVVDGRSVRVPILRTERQDVAQAHGRQHLHAGFDGAIPEKVGDRLRVLDDAALRVVRVLHRGVALPLAQNAWQTTASAGHIDRCEAFQLEGWAVVDGRQPKTLCLSCHGKVYPLKPIWLKREDVVQTLGIESIALGFQAELPGYLWAEQRERTPSLSLQADGRTVGQPIQLSREQVRSWIEAVCLAETPDQYRLFCALEHAHYANLYPQLTAPVREKLSAFAVRFGLTTYLGQAVETTLRGIAVPWQTRWLWNALRNLNARLTEPSDAESFWEAGMAIAEELPQQVRAGFYDSIIPSLCRLGIFERLLAREDYEPERWLGWESATDAWSLTIALAAWSARRRLDKCADILWRLSKYLDQGWINTECMAYAARQAVRGFVAGQVSLSEIDKFIYAYLGVLDDFQGDWHSRLYDEALMGGALRLLDGMPRYADYLHGDLTRGLLKHYGLLPLFWQRLEPYAHHLTDDPLWQQARQDAERLFTWIADATAGGNMAGVLAALRRFDRLGNPDARRFAREWLGPCMEQVNRDAAHPGHPLLDFLLEEPTEGVRYAAFPMVDAAALADRYPACGEALFDTLRSLTKREKDLYFKAHLRLGARIAALADGLRRGDPSAHPEADALWRECLAEAAQGDALALDLASWLAAHPQLPQKPSVVAGRLLDSLTALPSGKLPPAPLMAAVARLHPQVSSPHAEVIAPLLAEKYPAGLPKTPNGSACLLASSPTTWPGDTLVVIYSCRKYLDSRIRAIRETWVEDLKTRGIPYVILVGDGNDTIEGDVLALDVSDRYEDLPQKTLKLIDWVYEHTDFQYLYKIDDDCYLDVARFFENLSYRRHHYYGRVIKRSEGSMDRAWHQSKSHSEHAQKTLDKSPEPSVYADGGGGWVLSRWAMHALRAARTTDAGQRLVTVSLMEDKLVGDLLALAGITPSDEEYISYQRRRTFGAAVPVGMWENHFYPNQVTPTVMCHLDTDRDHAHVRGLRESRELWPKKLWPTCAPVRLDAKWTEHGTLGSNQLELLSPPEKLSDRLAVPTPIVVAVMRNEMTLLPHFLAHYRRLGLACFLIADNCSDDGTREYLLEQPDVALFSVDTEYKHSHYGVAWQQALLGNFCLNRWVVLADADEFLIYPGCEARPLADYLAQVEAGGANAVRVGMVDMYPYGELDEADFTRQDPFHAAPWFDAHPLTPWRLGSGYYSNDPVTYNSALRHRIDPDVEPNAFVSIKTAVVRYQPWMRFARGLHYATGVLPADEWAGFAHFKYHAGFKAKVETEVTRSQHFDNAKEYRRYQALLAEGKGRFGADGLSRRYGASQDFQNLIEETRNE